MAYNLFIFKICILFYISIFFITATYQKTIVSLPVVVRVSKFEKPYLKYYFLKQLKLRLASTSCRILKGVDEIKRETSQ
jgi:hypothetical protein